MSTSSGAVYAAIFAERERRKVSFDKIFLPDHFYEIVPQKPAFKVYRWNDSATA